MSGAFKKQQAIYEQIAEALCDRILKGELAEEEKISSIRETAITMEVNPNTVQRAYEWMQQQEIIYTKRGRGYFVAAGAPKQIMNSKKQEFLKETLPEFFKTMQLLNIEQEELMQLYQEFIKENTDENL